MDKVRWGIIAPGRIADTFAKALCNSEGSTLYAVASRDIRKAEEFAKKYSAQKFYGDYDSLFKDGGVDIVYIASTTAQHYSQAKSALMNGKNVLCEKTVTLNSAQFTELMNLAREKNLFFMEAMWMKFLPAFRKAKDWINEGRIGAVRMIKADFTNLCPFDENDRLYRNDLGGGCILDLGVYPLTFACDILGYRPFRVESAAYIGKTNVDYDASFILYYPGAFARCDCGFDCENENAAFIVGSKGRIRFERWFFCTDTALLYDENGTLVEKYHHPHDVNGYEYEIYEVEKCLKQGKKESEINPMIHTLSVLQIMDNARQDWGLRFEGE